MRDPYLFEDSQVLKNKLNIKEQEKLDEAEDAFFADGKDFSKKEYLERIVYDALGDALK